MLEKIQLRLIILFLAAICLNATGPQRIVSTAPSITEMLFALGLGPRVVGVTIYCKYPDAVLKLPKIGTFLKPDVEAIIALHPDLVVVEKQPNRLPEQLSRLHIRYVEVANRNLDAVYEAAREIGKAAGDNAASEHLVQSMQSELHEIRLRTAGRAKPTVAFIVGHTAGRLEGLVAGASNSYFSDLIEIAGGTNIFADSAAPYPKISLEEILSRNPDVILEMSGESRPKQDEVISLWQSRRSLRAVLNGRVFAIPSSAFLVPGPRAVEAARTLLHLLHPELQP